MRIRLLTFIIIVIPMCLIGQETLDQFNSLPPTKIRKAPDFDTESKYTMYYDDVMDLLFIKEENRHPVTKQLGYDQMIYEIPMKLLSNSSFRIEEDVLEKEVTIQIDLVKDAPKIHTYWIEGKDILTILASSKLGLGPWENNEKLKKFLEQLVSQFTEKYSRIEGEIDPYEDGKTIFKFATNRVTMRGKKVLDGRLNDEYYFSYSVTHSPQYGKWKNLKSIERLIRKEVEKYIGKNSEMLQGTPVFIYLDEQGKLESVFIGIDKGKNLKGKIDLDEFRNGARNNGVAVKCKFVIIL